MVREYAAVFACAFTTLTAAGCASTAEVTDLDALGLEYRLQELHAPRPNRVHVLRVDLTDKRIRPAVVVGSDPDGDGPAETMLTGPFKLADDPSVVAFVNTNPWDSFPNAAGKKNRMWYPGQPVDIHGLAIAGGQVRSPSGPSAASVWFNEQGRVFLGHGPDDRPAEATAGFGPIVREGAVVVSSDEAVHPRTAVGVNRDGTVLWLVVVDGRQRHFSEGMSLNELGNVMLDLGCWHATNMDGGGSSIMGLADRDGKLQVMNSPSDRVLGLRRIRPLPMVLTIRRQSSSGQSPDMRE